METNKNDILKELDYISIGNINNSNENIQEELIFENILNEIDSIEIKENNKPKNKFFLWSIFVIKYFKKLLKPENKSCTSPCLTLLRFRKKAATPKDMGPANIKFIKPKVPLCFSTVSLITCPFWYISFTLVEVNVSALIAKSQNKKQTKIARSHLFLSISKDSFLKYLLDL